MSWTYDPQTMKTTGNMKHLVTNMTNDDHTTRTLLVPKHVDGLLIIARGSTSNIDPEAQDLGSGHSQIRAFNITNQTSVYQYTTEGLRLGWGLRN